MKTNCLIGDNEPFSVTLFNMPCILYSNIYIFNRLDIFSDNKLMLKVKAGDIDKLGLLFERHKKLLFGYFYKLTGSRDASEDLVQNVFVRILKFRKQFRGEGKFSTWMYSIARNELADHFKKQKRRPETATFYAWRDDIAEDSLNSGIEKERRLKLVEESLVKLSSEKRELLIMSRYQGLKYKEIAEVYKASEGAIKVKIFRALNELRQIFHELEKSKIS